MKILAMKPGHDGSTAYVVDGVLNFLFEAEKDSGNRYAPIDVSGFLEALRHTPYTPDALVLSGWAKGANPHGQAIGAGYLGLNQPTIESFPIFGTTRKLITSSHERSHIFASYALSPYPQGEPCYALVWEGHIGSFYFIDRNVNIQRIVDVMVGPGVRYAFAYGLADPTFSLGPGKIRLSDAGKVMALAAFEPEVSASAEEAALLSQIFSAPHSAPVLSKPDFSNYSVHNSGVESTASKRLARLVSDKIYTSFLNSIRPFVQEKYPLLISGGCGLNCEWNRAWLDSNIFSDVFIPPCTNDTGSAVGSAADAQYVLTGNAKLQWNVYCGQDFQDDVGHSSADILGAFRRKTSSLTEIAKILQQGAILAWVAGKAEMGPRALGNRSLLAAPFNKSMLRRINKIKNRESFRPIAPVCLEQDSSTHFEIEHPSPFMLNFCEVKTDLLQATTHVDNSSRVQTVTKNQNPLLFELLTAFKAETGFGVLCNTSLNFSGTGFINRTSELIAYANQANIDGFVIEGNLFLRNEPIAI